MAPFSILDLLVQDLFGYICFNPLWIEIYGIYRYYFYELRLGATEFQLPMVYFGYFRKIEKGLKYFLELFCMRIPAS